MKRILMALLVVGLVSSAAGYGTMAYFNDTETAQDNTMNAGTIDMAVDGKDPWSYNYSTEVKPSQNRQFSFEVINTGTNPMEVYKNVTVTGVHGGLHPEPEWNVDPDNSGDFEPKDVEYSLHFEVRNETGSLVTPPGGVEVYFDGDGVSVGDVNGSWVHLYTLEPGDRMDVVQDYHMDAEIGNEAQGDIMTFDMTLLGIQTNAPEPTPAAP